MVLFIVVLIVLCVGLYVIDETYKTIKSILEGKIYTNGFLSFGKIVTMIIISFMKLYVSN